MSNRELMSILEEIDRKHIRYQQKLAWKRRNSDHMKKYNRNYFLKNKEKFCGYTTKRYKAIRLQVLLYMQFRRLLKKDK